jgi:hypothetical protein
MAALLASSMAVSAATATVTVSAGSLAFVSAPGNVTFPVTLNGVDQAPTQTQPIDVGDATGSGTGWNITATSTTFTTGTKNLSTTATTATGATVACDTSVTCTTATNTITYPYALPAATSAPVATKLFNGAANTGMGNQTVTPTWKVLVPANTSAGSYTSTWTISLVSGP